MKICVAQLSLIKADINASIKKHLNFIELAIDQNADIIVFPELSLTGYEPELAKELALNASDSILDPLQEICDRHRIVIGLGAPTIQSKGVAITMIIFSPGLARQSYFKKYLFSDEHGFFVSGENNSYVFNSYPVIAPAICYELSVPEHAENAAAIGAGIYISSVVKDKAGLEKGFTRLSFIAQKYKMMVFMSNCVGETGGYDCKGSSAVWDTNGVLLSQLDMENEGIIIADTVSKHINTRYFSAQESLA